MRRRLNKTRHRSYAASRLFQNITQAIRKKLTGMVSSNSGKPQRGPA